MYKRQCDDRRTRLNGPVALAVSLAPCANDSKAAVYTRRYRNMNVASTSSSLMPLPYSSAVNCADSARNDALECARSRGEGLMISCAASLSACVGEAIGQSNVLPVKR